MFTDSAGREVELPKDVKRIAPSGPLAQIVLFTLCPDKLVGFASDISDAQFEYIDKKYASLPVFGNFYGDTLNLESLMVAAPQIIIDIGEAKPNIADDMSGIEERTGIPTIFVQMEMDSMLTAYETLGMVTGETEQARMIIDYISQTLTETEQKAGSIPGAEQIRVYYGQDDGLTAVVSGTVHSDVIDAVGGFNVAEVEESVRGGASIISMEQLMLWNPDVVLFAPESIYDTVTSMPEWQEISAIKTGRFYEVPNGPYNWMGRPPSVNRVLGVKWLSNLLYPDIFKYDMASETREFYKLFYHCDVTDAQIEALLSKSTFK
jgi:iron complex transport system substrate-binding protein